MGRRAKTDQCCGQFLGMQRNTVLSVCAQSFFGMGQIQSLDFCTGRCSIQIRFLVMRSFCPVQKVLESVHVHCTPALEQTCLIVARQNFSNESRVKIAKGQGYTTHTQSPNRHLREEVAKNQVLLELWGEEDLPSKSLPPLSTSKPKLPELSPYR
jgi:hypothetical protein